jgi:hypothetical protein
MSESTDRHAHTNPRPTHPQQCIARLDGLEAARESLEAWKGYDARLCMMEVLELFKGEATLDEVRVCFGRVDWFIRPID